MTIVLAGTPRAGEWAEFAEGANCLNAIHYNCAFEKTQLALY